MNANTLPKGTTNADGMARRAAALPRGVGQAHPLVASRALNAEVWDVEGRRYIDFVAGIAVVLENRFADVVREYLAINGHRYRLEGVTASVYVTVNAGIYTGLKWLADDPPHVSLGDLVERLGQLVEQLVAPA